MYLSPVLEHWVEMVRTDCITRKLENEKHYSNRVLEKRYNFKLDWFILLDKNNGKSLTLFFHTTWHNWASTAEPKNHLEAADEVAPRKRLTCLLKLAPNLMARIWAGREFHNWAVDGRNGLAWLTRFDLGTSTSHGSSQTIATYGHGHEYLTLAGITALGPLCRTFDRRGWLLQLLHGGSMAEYDYLHTHWWQTNDTLSSMLDGVKPS